MKEAAGEQGQVRGSREGGTNPWGESDGTGRKGSGYTGVYLCQSPSHDIPKVRALDSK